jgi:hypothetical protein
MEKKSVGLLELEMAVLECFLEKTPLSPLGVKQASILKKYTKNHRKTWNSNHVSKFQKYILDVKELRRLNFLDCVLMN